MAVLAHGECRAFEVKVEKDMKPAALAEKQRIIQHFESLSLRRMTMIAPQAYEIKLFSDGRLIYLPTARDKKKEVLLSRESLALFLEKMKGLSLETLKRSYRTLMTDQTRLNLVITDRQGKLMVVTAEDRLAPESLKLLQKLLFDALKVEGLNLP